MAHKKGTGLYMVWTDVPADKEEEFNRWYNEEHIGDLLAIPGFLDAARYVAVSGGPKYLACYELDAPAVLDSPAYQRHRENPTEWTQRMSPRIIATNLVSNVYQQIFPAQVSQVVAQSNMAQVLQIGRMGIPTGDEDRFNEFYNTVYAPNYEKVPGCIRFRRYRATRGEPKYSVVYELEHEKVSQSPEWEAARRASGGPLGDTFPQMVHAEGSPGIYKKIFPL